MLRRHFTLRSAGIAATARPLAPLVLALALGACSTTGGPFASSSTGTVPADASAYAADELDEVTEKWAKTLAENPEDKTAAISMSRLLRAQDKKPQAVAIMRRSASHHPDDAEVLGELGKALADAGNLQDAEKMLGQAIAAGNSGDWRLHSSYGTVLDQLKRHEEARESYQRALKIEPDEPSVLSNMGLSHALDRNLPEAESVLRRAARQPGATRAVKENLALVLGLQGKFDEAEQVAREALPEQEVASNTSYLKKMMSQPSSWSKMQALEAQNQPATN